MLEHVKYRKDYQKPDFLIPSIQLEFELGETKTIVSSCLNIKRTNASQKNLILNGEGLELISVTLNDIILKINEYRYEDNKLFIDNVPDEFSLKTKVQISPNENKALMGLYHSRTMLCTQCEAEGFRRITFFLDRPDVLSVFSTKLIGDKKSFPVLLSNGDLKEQGEAENGQHWVQWHDPYPKPCYLFALVAGRLSSIQDEFITASKRKVLIEFYVEETDLHKCAHAILSLKQAMQWDEETYGREYDLDRYMVVAVSDFNMGAMENKGLNIFNSKYVLADEKLATDTDYENITAVIGHEYFHNWSGNRVTCQDWFQLSLKEGLTVFREQEFSMAMSRSLANRINDVILLKTKQFAEDAGPMAHPVRPESYLEINNFYTMTVYEKGAELIRMLALVLGKEAYRKAMDLYFERHDGQAVTIDDFLACMQACTKVDLSSFKYWYSEAGTPVIKVHSEYNLTTKIFTVKLEQVFKKTLLIPIELALLGSDGKILHQSTILFTEERKSYDFTGILEQPVLSILGNFSAPVRVEKACTKAELSFLAKHSPYLVERWSSLQSLVVESIFERSTVNKPIAVELVDAFKTLLNNPPLDLKVLAKMLTFPNMVYLVHGQEQVKLAALAAARKTIILELAEALEGEFLNLYDACAAKLKKTKVFAELAGLRALRNTCLAYLLCLGESYTEKALGQIQAASNMTDHIGALSALLLTQPKVAKGALDKFYSQFKEEALVIDKWFSLQALIEEPSTIEMIQDLLDHPAFDLNNPNKVHALLGSFANQNLVVFHREDGAGHILLADCILAIDQQNPQLAARLVGVFSHWRQFEEPIQASILQQLNRIKISRLSRDCFEIVSKMMTSPLSS